MQKNRLSKGVTNEIQITGYYYITSAIGYLCISINTVQIHLLQDGVLLSVIIAISVRLKVCPCEYEENR